MKRLLFISLPLILFSCAAIAGVVLLSNWTQLLESLKEYNACEDSTGLHREQWPEEVPAFKACLATLQRLYLEKDYAESKDLAKTFLTLVAAILVASITFSEKIVDVSKASFTAIGAMIICWLLLLLSIIFCGAGLAALTAAAGVAAYQPARDYHYISNFGIKLGLLSGVAFVFALVALITAGIISLYEKKIASSLSMYDDE